MSTRESTMEGRRLDLLFYTILFSLFVGLAVLFAQVAHVLCTTARHLW